MKLAAALSGFVIAACGGTPTPPLANRGGAAAHVAGDVDGDGRADTVTFADNTVTLNGLTLTIPAWDFTAASARVVELGGQAVIAVESEINEDDLTWGIIQHDGTQLRWIGDVFLGSAPGPADLPGDGTIHATTGNCGQSTALTYTIRPGAIDKGERTTGVYDVAVCAACPYVLVDTGAGLRFVGESLRNLAGRARAGEDALALPAIAAGQREVVVVLEEVKPETTYLDALSLDFAGVRVAPRGCGAACVVDDAPEVIALGQRRRFVFDVPAGFAGAPVLYARGYYQPFAARAAR